MKGTGAKNVLAHIEAKKKRKGMTSSTQVSGDHAIPGPSSSATSTSAADAAVAADEEEDGDDEATGNSSALVESATAGTNVNASQTSRKRRNLAFQIKKCI